MPNDLTAASLLEAVPFAIVVLDARGRIARVNAAFERMFGQTRDDVAGAALMPFVELPAAPSLLVDEADVIHEGLGHLGNGRLAPLDVTVRPLRPGERGPLLLTLVDITARRDAEARFRIAVEASPHGMIMVDQTGVIVLVNSEIESIFGYTRDELIGQSIDILVPAALRGRHHDQRSEFAHDASRRPMGVGRDLFGRHKDGSEKQVEIGLSRIAMADGAYVLASVVDIHARKETEEALRRSNEELERFAHVASHDLQEPLRTVASYVQLIERRYRGVLGPDGVEFIDYAVDGVQRMRGLIDDLLAFSRLGSQTPSFERTDMQDLLRDVCDRLHVAIDEAGATVSGAALPAVWGDPRQLERLLTNLVGNALKFRAATPPTIDVSARRTGRQYTFTVADNGIGIDPQYADRIFVIFQRLHLREEYPGTGMGLAICKKIVERHGGRIWVESAPGAGARFHFTLPAPAGEEH